MYVLWTYLNLHHDFVAFNTQSSCFKYPLPCLSWQFFPKGSNVSRSSFNGSKSNPHPPNTAPPGRGDRKGSNRWRAVLRMPSMKWWCTWLPCHHCWSSNSKLLVNLDLHKKGKISKPQSNLGLDLFLLTSMCWSMTAAVIVQENCPHKSYLCLKAHL